MNVTHLLHSDKVAEMCTFFRRLFWPGKALRKTTMAVVWLTTGASFGGQFRIYYLQRQTRRGDPLARRFSCRVTSSNMGKYRGSCLWAGTIDMRVSVFIE